MPRKLTINEDVVVNGTIVVEVDGVLVDVRKLLAEVGKTLPAQAWTDAKTRARP